MRLLCKNGGLVLPRMNVGEGTVGPMPIGPGENEIPDAYWAELMKLAHIERWATGPKAFLVPLDAAGDAAEVPDPPLPDLDADDPPVAAAAAGEPDAEPCPLLEVNAKEAILMVESCDNVHTLASWGVEDERKTVREAIEKRIAELSGG